jgi:hypothetical protein
MRNFKIGQRIRVIDDDFSGPLKGRTGTVHRLRRAGNAWICMDDDLPIELQSFDRGDPRFRHIIIDPDECVAIEEPT